MVFLHIMRYLDTHVNSKDYNPSIGQKNQGLGVFNSSTSQIGERVPISTDITYDEDQGVQVVSRLSY